MNFEIEYQLEQFREVQDQYFDENNKCYTGVNLSASIMESMLKLINGLSEQKESTELSEAHETKALHIADVSSSADFRESANPLLKYLAEKHHPHTTAIITSTSIELVEGIKAEHNIYDYIQD